MAVMQYWSWNADHRILRGLITLNDTHCTTTTHSHHRSVVRLAEPIHGNDPVAHFGVLESRRRGTDVSISVGESTMIGQTLLCGGRTVWYAPRGAFP